MLHRWCDTIFSPPRFSPYPATSRLLKLRESKFIRPYDFLPVCNSPTQVEFSDFFLKWEAFLKKCKNANFLHKVHGELFLALEIVLVISQILSSCFFVRSNSVCRSRWLRMGGRPDRFAEIFLIRKLQKPLDCCDGILLFSQLLHHSNQIFCCNYITFWESVSSLSKSPR